MTVLEAAKASGYAPFTIRQKIREKQFLACKPCGNRGGWDINETNFRMWLKKIRNSSWNR